METLQTAGLQDLDSIFRIEQDSFPAHVVYAKKEIQKAIREDKVLFFMADGECVGYTWLEFSPQDHSSYIESIAIAPAHRGKGLGEKLLLKVLDHFREHGAEYCYLHVSSHNKQAVNLYKKHGFIKIDYIENFYAQHEHAYLMENKLY